MVYVSCRLIEVVGLVVSIFSFFGGEVFLNYSLMMSFLVNLRYMNVFFGEGLELFLDEAGNQLNSFTIYSDSTIVTSSYRHTGKFSEYGRTLSIMDIMNYRLALYLVSWLFKLVSMCLVRRVLARQSISEISLNFVKYQRRVHLAIFYIFVSDGAISTARSISQIYFKSASLMMKVEKVLAFLVFFLMWLDIVEIIMTGLTFRMSIGDIL